MRFTLKNTVSLLCHLSIAQAGVTHFISTRSPYEHPNLHSVYTDPRSGQQFFLLVKDYQGPVANATLSDWTPEYNFTRAADLALYDRDICQKVAACAGYLRDATAYYAAVTYEGLSSFCLGAANTVNDYYTANGYAHAYAVLDGVVGNLVLLLPTAIGTFYFTSWLQKDQGSNNNNDACGATQPQVIASTTGSAMYQFCMSLTEYPMNNVDTRFVWGDDTTTDPTFNDNDGVQLVSKFNIGSVEFDVLDVCKDYGITWRRDFNSALERGMQRSTKMITA